MDEFYRTLKKQSFTSRTTIPDMSAETLKKRSCVRIPADVLAGIFEAVISRNASL